MAGLRNHPKGVRDYLYTQYNASDLRIRDNTFLFNYEDDLRRRASAPPYGRTGVMPARGGLTLAPGPPVGTTVGDACRACTCNRRAAIRCCKMSDFEAKFKMRACDHSLRNKLDPLPPHRCTTPRSLAPSGPGRPSLPCPPPWTRRRCRAALGLTCVRGRMAIVS